MSASRGRWRDLRCWCRLWCIGIGLSKVVPGIAERGDLIFGVPAIQRMLEWIIFPHVRSADILLHPVARAAWVGILATALNLLPIGQLDGGHILYAFTGRWHKLLSRIFVLALVPLGILLFATVGWFGRRCCSSSRCGTR